MLYERLHGERPPEPPPKETRMADGRKAVKMLVVPLRGSSKWFWKDTVLEFGKGRSLKNGNGGYQFLIC